MNDERTLSHLSLWSLILGIIAIILNFVVYIGIKGYIDIFLTVGIFGISFIIEIIAIILGITGIIDINKNNKKGKFIATVGIILSFISFLIEIYLFYRIF